MMTALPMDTGKPVRVVHLLTSQTLFDDCNMISMTQKDFCDRHNLQLDITLHARPK